MSEYLEQIPVTETEIVAESSESAKVKYIFQVLSNQLIDKTNIGLDMKEAKTNMKEAEFEPAKYVEAKKYMDADGVNKKMEQAEVVEEYMTFIKNGSEKFEGLDKPIDSCIERQTDVKDGLKNIKDRCSELGVNYKALEQLSKEYVDSLNPNKKTKEKDIVFEKIIEDYMSVISV